MFVVSITYTVDLTEVDPYIEAHLVYLEKYYAAGNFVVSGRKVPRTGGVILVQADSKAVLENILQEDPFAKANIAEYEITEFIPTKVTAGLESIIGEQK
ncbi:MAG: hypothetical protein ACJATV_001138 [Granulosicoccus sp.]|jgi:uncharacterized protein YciI